MSHVDPFGLEDKPRLPYPDPIPGSRWIGGSLVTTAGGPAREPNARASDRVSASGDSFVAANKAVSSIARWLSPFGSAESLFATAVGMAQQAMRPDAHFSAQGAATGVGQAIVGTLAQGAHDPLSRIALESATGELASSNAQMAAGGDMAPAVAGASTHVVINLVLGAAEGGAAAGEPVTLFHGHKTPLVGGEFNLDAARANIRPGTPTPGVYMTNELLRAATQYATPSGYVTRVQVSASAAAEMFQESPIRGPGGVVQYEWVATTPQQVELLNRGLQTLPQGSALRLWLGGR